jgi:hypothetical protein
MLRASKETRLAIQIRSVLLTSAATLSMLAGCVATVRVPAPVVYTPPPSPVVASVQVETPPVAVEVQATEPPPPLPDYQQPPCPEEGWLWTPGYWAFSSGGYYWVPGTWVEPPAVGVLWTPGYWGFVGGVYRFNAGYWGPHVGFYGGVNYGYGYSGVGFVGGRWDGGHFAYNTAVVNVNTTVVHNTYVNTTVINNTTVNRVSYNGPGGVAAQPTPSEKAAMAEPHTPPTTAQTSHLHEALRNPQLSAKSNGGHPPIAATARPAAFSGPGVVGAKGAPPLKAESTARMTPPAPREDARAPHSEVERNDAAHKPMPASVVNAPLREAGQAPTPPRVANTPAPKPAIKTVPKPLHKAKPEESEKR